MNLAVFLVGIGITFYSISLIVCIVMIILICTRIRSLKSNISIVLVVNTYFTCSLTDSIMLIMCIYTLLGNLDPSKSFDGPWCRCRSYVTYVSYSALYLSFALQAIFRLVHVVFSRNKTLQSFRVCLIAIAIKWIMAFLFILPNLLLDDFQYLTSEFNCWIAFQNIRGLIIDLFTIFSIPLSVIFTTYTLIIRHTRRTGHLQKSRQKANQRDLAVIKRIFILIFIVVIIGLPACAVIIIYMITNRVVPYANHIQGLSIAIGVFILSISLIFITPRLTEVFLMNRNRVNPHGIPMAMTIRQTLRK